MPQTHELRPEENMNEKIIGQVYRDIDRGRLLRVLFVATPEVHKVKKPIAACYSAGKVTTVSIDRLLNPSRFEIIPQPEENA